MVLVANYTSFNMTRLLLLEQALITNKSNFLRASLASSRRFLYFDTMESDFKL